ncbi:PA14 domain-containing protein [Tunicatimonas sp.]|uniref:PA14 domain-containing protein n=1 Tax=Tunicatimonas sp. TaxID=1940096 RepID=UPI003C71EC57
MSSQLSWAQVSLVVSPARTNVEEGEIFSVEVIAQTGNQLIDEASVFLLFNPKTVQVQSSDASPNLPVALTPISFDNTTGLISYAYSTLDNLPSGDVLLFTVTFKAIATSSSILIFTSVGGNSTELSYQGVSVLSENRGGRIAVGSAIPDGDSDGIPDDVDNCPNTVNANQADLDEDGIGDVCDGDADDDGIATSEDCDDLNAELGTAGTWYADNDGDGFGNPNVSTEACEPPEGFVTDNTDCDDSEASIYLTAEEIPDDGIDNNCNGQIDENAALCQAGFILQEFWFDVAGINTTDIPYLDIPQAVETLTQFASPINVGANYGSRIRGYLCPPTSGEYTFFIAGDDNCELFLSSDATENNKVKIAEVPDWTKVNDYTKYPAQRSQSVRLEAEAIYYIEALHKEGGGGDHLSVAWLPPEQTEQTVIPGQYLSPFAPALRPADTPG